MKLWVADYQSVDDYHLYGVFTTRAKAVDAIGFDPEIRPRDPKAYWSWAITAVTVDKVRKKPS
jgi:hypothetical protein